MQRSEIERIFEAYFEKYKKTEGDRTSWSAVWLESVPSGVLELNLTKCPRGTTFKIFVDKKMVAEVLGWDEFFSTMQKVSAKYPDLYDEEKVFSEMEYII